MAIKFGGVKSGIKLNELSSEKLNVVLVDTVKENSYNPYYIFLLDNIPDVLSKNLLIKEINKVCKEYLILLSCDKLWYQNDLRGNGIAQFFVNHRSNWRKYVDYKGRHVSAIIPFGQALYSINESADIMTSDFIADDFVWPYYYMGNYLWRCDSYIFPVFGIKDLWPRVEKSLSSVNWKTRFSIKQFERATSSEERLYKPDFRKPEFQKINSKEECDKLFNDNMNAFLVAWDTETSGLTFYKNSRRKYLNVEDVLTSTEKDKIRCLTISFDGIKGYFIPIEYVDLNLFVKCIMSAKHNTGANPKFDIKFFYELGASRDLMVTDATDMAAHAIHSDRSKGLKPQAFFFTPHGGYETELDKWRKETKCDDYSKIPEEVLLPYATMDSIVTWQVQYQLFFLIDYLDKKIKNTKIPEWTIRRWYEEQMMTIYQCAVETEYNGIYVNWDLMNKHREIMQKDVQEKHQKLREIWNLPNDFNITSVDELGKAFEKMGFPEHGRNKKGLYSTDEDAVSSWIREGLPGVDLLSEVRNELTVCNSFLGYITDKNEAKGWLQYIQKHDDGTVRIHHSYNVMGTTSFRFIGTNPNFQNIPARGKFAPYIKMCIDTPPADLYIFTSDSGTEYKLSEFEYILTRRGYVQAKDLVDNDVIIENNKYPTVLKYEITKQNDGKYKHTPGILFQTIDSELIKKSLE